MKIRIIGAPWSGKTSLAKNISKNTNIPILHLDDVIYVTKYIKKRTKEDRKNMVEKYLWENDNRIIEWTAFAPYRESFEQADQIIYLEKSLLQLLIFITRRSLKFTDWWSRLHCIKYAYRWKKIRKESIINMHNLYWEKIIYK